MNDNFKDSIYYSLGLEQPQEMIKKAFVIGEILQIMDSQKISIGRTAVILQISEAELHSILAGHFQATPILILKKYLSVIRCY